MPKKMLLAVPFVLAMTHTAFGKTESETRCRVGNGKSVTYLDEVNACLKARADGKKVKFVKGTDPDAQKQARK
jgi:hypothetical protein